MYSIVLSTIVTCFKKRQLLPLYTLLLFFQTIFYVIIIIRESLLSPWISLISTIFLLLNIVIVICGYILLILLYRHSVRTIFNRNIPSTCIECIPSFCQHLLMLRPLEIIFRYLTRHLRMLPDVIVLGEVRCGTTTLCHHLTHLDQVYFQGPFCLWDHPEMDHKESFYFVGHYLGYVTPYDYRMCFPLKIEKWWYNHKHLFLPWKTKPKKPFLVFDGCAQYLTSPTAPYLIAEAYHHYTNTSCRPPLLIACIREPISQAISWWRYENAAIIWGQNMGLNEWNLQLRSPNYPPKTILNALHFSSSPFVETRYRDAESLVTYMLRTKSRYIHMPSWAITWPAGQMSVFGRSSKYRTNIEKYERVFESYFKPIRASSPSSISSNDFRFTYLIPTESLSEHLIVHLSSILLTLSHNKFGHDRTLLVEISQSVNVSNVYIRRNATTIPTKNNPLHQYKDVDEDERKILYRLLCEDIKDFQVLVSS